MVNLDPVTFEIVKNNLVSTAEEMGVALQRSAFSANIKERRDFSCALFDTQGEMVAQAEHIPVHLGAMPLAVEAILDEYREEVGEGDVFILNDPYRGGTHLPDITITTPVFYKGRLVGFTANRAHHADIGGGTPGSMSSLSTDVYQEGFRIPPVKLVEKGKARKEILDLVLSNVRTPNERFGDLRAQQAANHLGIRRIGELIRMFGLATLLQGMEQLKEYSRRLMKREISRLPVGSASAVDYLDDDGWGAEHIPIRVKVEVESGKLRFDLKGSAAQVKGPLNAVYSITLSAIYYVVRCVTDPGIPPNQGCFDPVEVLAPQGTIVNASPPAPVAGGNVETSQRIVDVALKAFAEIVPERVCAACQGTMNNITIGGYNPRTDRYFTYYETIAGGFGARASKDGIDGVHSHMTNTLNTPIEALEQGFPLRVRRYELVKGSGGRGKFRGGLGVRREIEILGDEATVSLLGERHKLRPWALHGGRPGSSGVYSILHRNGRVERVPSKSTVIAKKGDVVAVSTPGGGGYGQPSQRLPNLISADRSDGKY